MKKGIPISLFANTKTNIKKNARNFSKKKKNCLLPGNVICASDILSVTREMHFTAESREV